MNKRDADTLRRTLVGIIVGLGGTTNDNNILYTHRLQTVYGWLLLSVDVESGRNKKATVFCRFDDPKKSISLTGPYLNGKWNHHGIEHHDEDSLHPYCVAVPDTHTTPTESFIIGYARAAGTMAHVPVVRRAPDVAK